MVNPDDLPEEIVQPLVQLLAARFFEHGSAAFDDDGPAG
jgi:hypothetical protein